MVSDSVGLAWLGRLWDLLHHARLCPCGSITMFSVSRWLAGHTQTWWPQCVSSGIVVFHIHHPAWTLGPSHGQLPADIWKAVGLSLLSPLSSLAFANHLP